MSRWKMLGFLAGLGVGASANALADCIYLYDYDEAELTIVSVSIDGGSVDDLSAYTGLGVTLRATSSWDAELIVTDADGVELTYERWE